MPVFTLLKQIEDAHAAYNECSEQLAQLLNDIKVEGIRSRDQLSKIAALNQQCEELLQAYLSAFRSYYGKQS